MRVPQIPDNQNRQNIKETAMCSVLVIITIVVQEQDRSDESQA